MAPIIPLPAVVEPGPAGAPGLARPTVVVPGPGVPARLAQVAAERLGRAAGAPVTVADPGTHDAGEPDPGTVTLLLDDDAGPAGSASLERYSLTVADGRAVARAADARGLHHAITTLCRLVELGGEGGAPGAGPVVVHDAPRYAWRGLSVDVARNFFGPTALERVVDLAADLRLNVLHLHLTDDQGWRIEIPSRPELTARGSGTQVGGGPGGFLTVAQYETLQDYAAARGVVVVPEVDLPGHTNAATHVYGDLRPDGVPTDAYRGIEVGFSGLSIDLPATEPFLRDVLGDLAAMTRGEHLHVGGDEVHRMAAPEYARFVELAERLVVEHGKTPVAWQEAAHAPLRPGTLVQFWDTNATDHAALVAAAERGTRFLLSPADRAYLDMKPVAGFPLGQEWAGLVELRDAYDWDPADVVAGLPPQSVVGVEAAVWTERIQTLDELLTMLLPRLLAVAEVAWTDPARRDWEGFRARVARAGERWRRDGVPYYASPQVDW
ncbi:family 20 glycosylhydrolase [Cellulomonas sp. PhB143]|uniref:family 20 glycosylhydrolase n=1 Tax=Cellulomonas sp. PhB143 TaxID=2485186 RepID=UPI000F4A4DAB|nr:family 20 glycosylhydrolase [Cellulomonas sp. PhB143]